MEKSVVKGTKVYDMIDWIPGRPGHDVNLRAVSGTIDKYWYVFTIHKNQYVNDIVDTYYVGELDPLDLINRKVPPDDIDDPFKTDPKCDSRLIVHTQRPCNAETAPEELRTYITPDKTFYVRHHLCSWS